MLEMLPLTPALSRSNSPWRVRNLKRPHPQANAVGRGSPLALATASLLPLREKDRMRGDASERRKGRPLGMNRSLPRPFLNAWMVNVTVPELFPVNVFG